MAKQQQRHVVAVPLPAQGHLNPLMRFCKVLSSQHGFLITFVYIDPVHHRLKALANKQQDAEEEKGRPVAGNIRTAHIPVQGLQDLDCHVRFSFQLVFEALDKGMGPPLEMLIRTLNHDGPPVTCILSDIVLTLPAQGVADKLNLPWIAFVPYGASMILFYYHVVQGERISITKVLEALSTRTDRREVFCDGLLGLPTIYNNELPYFRNASDLNMYWESIKEKCEKCFRHTRAVVFNSFEDLEAPALTALSQCLNVPVYGVGPLVEPLHEETSTSLWREDEACILWLDQQPPLSVLYISFGTTSFLSQTQLEELLAGLLSCHCRFLWAFRPDLVQNADYSSTFVSDALSRSHGKGYIVDWAPQLSVLSHPSVGGFLTHCGWNSIVEAVAHGVPMLCWPYSADQFLNAKYVVEIWEVGVQFEGSSSIEKGETERMVKALMEGEEGQALRKNAMRLKEAGSQSLLPGGRSHNHIQRLLRSLNTRTS